MKEEMYIPGQDDFPGWDEFYSARPLSRERMRYSFKTLMLLPLLLAAALWTYLLGVDRSKDVVDDLTKQLNAARTSAQANERAANAAGAAALLDRQIRDRTVHETRAAMKALIQLAIEIRTHAETAPEFRDNANRMLAPLGERLKATANTLRAETGADLVSQTAIAENDAVLWSHLDLGEALAIVGGTNQDGDADARREFQEARDLARSIVHFHSASPQAQSNLLVVEARFGDFNRQAGRSEAARDNYRDALAAAADYDSVVPRKAELPRRLIAALTASEGDALLQSGLAPEAADAYKSALAFTRDASLANAQNGELKRDMAVLYGKLGDAHLLVADPAQSRNGRPHGFDLSWTIVTSDPLAPAPMRNDYFRFAIPGDANRQPDDLARARTVYEKSMAILRRLAGGESQSAQRRADLAHGLARIGCLQMAAENFASAVDSIQEAIAILEQRHGEGARNGAALAVASLIGSEAFTAALGQSLGKAADANPSAEKAPSLTASPVSALAHHDAADHDAAENCLRDLREKLAYCNQARAAIDDLKFIGQRPKSELPQWLALRGRALARGGRADDAAATADLLTRVPARRGENLLAAAEIYAILAAGAQPMAAPNGDSPDDDPQAEPPAVREAKVPPQSAESSRVRKLQDAFATRAVDLFRNAAEAGALDDVKIPSSILSANGNLAALAGRDDFQALLVELDAAAAEKAQKKN